MARGTFCCAVDIDFDPIFRRKIPYNRGDGGASSSFTANTQIMKDNKLFLGVIHMELPSVATSQALQEAKPGFLSSNRILLRKCHMTATETNSRQPNIDTITML